MSVVTHGLGGPEDLPIPAGLAIAGACAALTFSFVILMLAWRLPRFGDPESGRPAPAWLANLVDSRGLAVLFRVVGLLFLGFVVWAAVAGPDVLTNPVFGITYVWLWVGIIPASLLFGPFFKAVSPARTLHLLVAEASGDPSGDGLVRLPSWVGFWPASVGLFAFIWLELVYPEAISLGPLRLWLALYLGAMLIGSVIFGSSWLERADPFEVYSGLLGHLSVWGRRPDGTLVLRSPLANLGRLASSPGLAAVVAVLLGSTAFDSFRTSSGWLRYSQGTEIDVTLLNTGLLLGFCGAVALTFGAATRRPSMFAHSVVPIIIGYMVAHYLTFFVESGVQTLTRASDPMGDGSNLFGTADWEVSYWLTTHPSTLATIKVLAIVTGHVLGVVAAHDRALRPLEPRRRIVGQLPLMVVMVFYTFAGLYLLFVV
ncbi:MAG: hypothetical protein ACR2FE_01405 [Aeromicrobium sp.]